MSGMGMMLKALGVSVPEETVHQIETLLPQLPGKLQQAVEVVNGAVTATHARLAALEGVISGQTEEIRRLREELNARRGNASNGKRRGDATYAGHGG